MVRVRPDVPAVDRAFDYVVPEALDARVRVGSLVRVPLHGRRVRGWVVADHVVPEAAEERLRPLLEVVGAGPPADVLDLAAWAAWRWAGPEVAFLRAASAPNVVRDLGPPPGAVRTALDGPAPELVVWPPAGDRRALVADAIATRGSTIVVVPEGTRLPALVGHLERAGHTVLVLRADRSDAERTQGWARSRAGGCVVVGGRTAVWAPVPDLAAVVVLDEGDEALKEERAPTWHAREVAIERARRDGARCVLVSPAPTVEAIVAAGEPQRPSRDVERAGWPIVDVVDLREEPPGTGLLSGALADALRRAVGAGGRAVCVLNRRGRARLLACVSCRSLARCERCGAAVVEGEPAADGARVLECPTCGMSRPFVCLECHAAKLRAVRPGVARLRDDLAALLPRVEVAEVDAATEEVPDAPVLVGTEAVLHRLPPRDAVRLVAFLDLDQELLAPRHRAAEQALWLLARAARRLGPRERGGRLLLQTRVPDHEVIDAVQRADPTIALAVERVRRAELGYPPFGGLAELRGDEAAVRAALDPLVVRPDLTVLGPEPTGSGLAALVVAPTVGALCDALALVAPVGRAAGRLRVEVDPLRV